ncbi:hypothetical protein ACP70R_028366 [Stipagrostis hirtigluma subsp. patula]
MWKLKICEGGSPLLQTCNGFLGRAVWEFHPNAGTPEERQHVEMLQRHFSENRFRRKESQDLLLRMQFAKLKSDQDDLYSFKLQDQEVTEETIYTSLRRALNQFCKLQAHDGHWPGDYSGILFIMPLLIISLHVSGTLDIILSSEHRREICRYIYNHQNEDGGWGTQVLGHSTMFGSCLNYVALRLLGEDLNGKSDALTKARTWILSHGSATMAPQWAKIWLSVIGVYDWSGNKAIIPELWMIPHFIPFHPAKFWCIARVAYMPMAYLYGKKFVGPITPTILEIREEVYNVPYSTIDWSKARDSCAKEDIRYPRSKVQKMLWAFLNKFVEPVLNVCPFNKLRMISLKNLMNHIHYEDENTKYIGLCPINKLQDLIDALTKALNEMAAILAELTTKVSALAPLVPIAASLEALPAKVTSPEVSITDDAQQVQAQNLAVARLEKERQTASDPDGSSKRVSNTKGDGILAKATPPFVSSVHMALPPPPESTGALLHLIAIIRPQRALFKQQLLHQAAMNMICCWIENPDSNEFMKHLPRIYDYLWLAEDGMKAQVYDGCQTWETSFIVPAFCSTGQIDEFGSTLEKAYCFLKNSQVLHDHPYGKISYRHGSRGSWTLSTADNGWSVPDCTGETLQALLLVSKIYPNIISAPIKEERLQDAVDCLLSFAERTKMVPSLHMNAQERLHG